MHSHLRQNMCPAHQNRSLANGPSHPRLDPEEIQMADVRPFVSISLHVTDCLFSTRDLTWMCIVTPLCACGEEQNTNKLDEILHRNISKTNIWREKCDFTLKHRMRLEHLGQACFDESSVILFSSERDVPNVSCLLSYPIKPCFVAWQMWSVWRWLEQLCWSMSDLVSTVLAYLPVPRVTLWARLEILVGCQCHANENDLRIQDQIQKGGSATLVASVTWDSHQTLWSQ